MKKILLIISTFLITNQINAAPVFWSGWGGEKSNQYFIKGIVSFDADETDNEDDVCNAVVAKGKITSFTMDDNWFYLDISQPKREKIGFIISKESLPNKTKRRMEEYKQITKFLMTKDEVIATGIACGASGHSPITLSSIVKTKYL